MCIRDSYYPGGMSLDNHTLSPSAKHYNNYTQYELQALNGHLEVKATNKFLREKLRHKFPFIISRSTFYGTGKYGAHWTGDNSASWEYLRLSIPHLFSYNLFGIPFVGADICGFNYNTTAQLCARWMQLGTLYPFARNHNHNETISQEPYAFNDLVTNTSRIALKVRYSLLKYYFTQFLIKNGTGTVFRPLFFEFPLDSNLYDNRIMNEQFLIGTHLMATPVLHQGADTVKVYFPQGAWYNIHSLSLIHI
eukprot:TRINITY_DN2245_c0_g1_i5.p1 TRINITY_DN2245_c0_g1~~TRINITY_DN2245_c0_g1_i5.p1  ORF type:complete len:250 (+),score=49.85 TRINITY_DN2245_c0_g1_i5:66-815(+)